MIIFVKMELTNIYKVLGHGIGKKELKIKKYLQRRER